MSGNEKKRPPEGDANKGKKTMKTYVCLIDGNSVVVVSLCYRTTITYADIAKNNIVSDEEQQDLELSPAGPLFATPLNEVPPIPDIPPYSVVSALHY